MTFLTPLAQINSLQFELVIPCLNESESLPDLIHQTILAARRFSLTPRDFQLVIVNNGSTDSSKQVLEELKASEEGDWFRVVSLDKNQGYGGGIYSGLKSTSAKWVGFTHADLQCNPEDAMKAFMILKEGQKLLVKGKRKNRNWLDWITSRGYEIAVGIFWNFWSFDLNAQPKVFDRKLTERLEPHPTGITFDAFVLKKAKEAGLSLRSISVQLEKRRFGESSWANGFKKRALTYLKVLKELRLQRLKFRNN